MKLLSALAVGLSIACAGPAAAAPARDVLKGFNGVEFGTTYDAAKVLLGSDVREGVDSAQPPNKTLHAKTRSFGEDLDVQYSFENEGRFSVATAKVELGDDFAVCKARWPTIVAQMRVEYGEPDTETEGTLLKKVTFNFADGAIVKAQTSGCLTLISFRSPHAK